MLRNVILNASVVDGQEAGGIIGDEMGLGKTIEVVAYLAGLHHSGKMGACLLMCPATIMNQWVREFHLWYPPIRAVLLHQVGAVLPLINMPE